MHMKTASTLEERLWEFIDGTCSDEEKTIVAGLIESNIEWKQKYSELLEINKLIQQSDMEAPSMRFTKNVMEEIGKMHIAPATKSYINKKIIWGLGFFFIGLIVSILVYGISQTEWNTGTNTTVTDQLQKIDFSKIFNNNLINVFMMINVILGLVLLDNYLSNKRKELRKEA